jgi:predicted lipoprotein with Yx(FWY)xxD motif
MHLPKYLLLTVAVVIAITTTTAVAFGATHTTTGSTAPATNSAGTGAKVAVANIGLGKVLVDGRGHTLYLFAKDTNGKSACAGKCAGFWPPLITRNKPVAAGGAKTSLLGTTRRPDGRLQVTYNHHPLYTFVKDTRKGQTNGEAVNAFGAEWYAVSATGAKVEKNDATNGGGRTGGYGY